MIVIDPALEKRAAGGDVDSQLALAAQLNADGRTQPARGWHARAAQLGNPVGMRALAASLLTRHPYDIANGMRFMRAAAEKGDADALRICAVLAAQDVALPDRWEVALNFLSAAAERGSVLARDEMALLAGRKADDAKSLRGEIDFARWLALPAPVPVRESPRISVFENFLTPETCDWLIARSLGRVVRAGVFDPLTGNVTVEDNRTNGGANFDITEWDLPLVFLRTRIAQIVGLPAHCLEHPTVLHYDPGQEFEPHFDFLDPEMLPLRREIAVKGQRVATFLIYLNDDYEGAETEFLELGIHHKGRKGDGLLFWNVDTDGKEDRRTLHAGRTPLSGEKWLLSQWIREEKRSSDRNLAVHLG
jgi:prolyl 4-hydroxylase